MHPTGRRIRLYAQLITLYPRAYRERFGSQILQTTVDLLEATATEKDRRQLWLQLALDLQTNLIRQHLIYLGDHMNHLNQRLLVSAISITVSLAAWLTFPHLRTIGTTWMNLAGGLRVIGLLSFIVLFIGLPALIALLALFGQPKALYKKLQSK